MAESLAQYFRDIRLLAALQCFPGEQPYEAQPPQQPERKALLLYLGCNVLRTAHLAKTAAAVLRAMGFDFHAVGGPAYCCGIVHYLQGKREAARHYAASSLRHVGAYAPEHVLIWCPSCLEHFDEVVSQEQTIGFPYEHFTAFVARHLDRLSFVRRVEKKVALHYHCGHPQPEQDWAHTRAILQAIPGLQYVEIANPPALGRHCSPKYISRLGQQAWAQHLDEVFRQAAAAGVEVLATIYHSCHRVLCHQEAAYPFAVVNYISLLGEALGLDYPDVYKRYRLLGDPEAILAEVQPYVAAHHLPPEQVRDVLYRTFMPPCARG
ncbi:MAG: hypothetical protein KatS3mg131_2727 [Candidatus Tectimicrobiota bacterium]|nr:MAG: hypothetical protein KatS3mg131_2727 [Candidatus Tectomicrobia bacterium]